MNNTLIVTISSFSFHYSTMPEDNSGNKGGFVFDCRFLPNPGRYEQYKQLTGKDKPVIDFLSEYKEVADFLESVYRIIDLAVQNYLSRGFSSLMISFGCTGGQHRSVFCAERLAAYLREKNVTVQLHHVMLEK
jgi:RNase adaptor protein for sRNA GlmZ degradation